MYSSLIKKSNQHGFALVEILVSLLILSITLLGMASMQISGLRNSATSSYRTDATQLSYDIADSMRANTLAVDDNVFDDVDVDSNDAVSDSGTGNCLQLTTSDNVESCSPDDMATADLSSWISRVRKKLPNASISITCNDRDTTDADDCTDASTHTITLTWDENNDGNIVASTFSYTFRP